MNRYNAIKRLNKSNFINLLSVCSEETLQEIFPVKKHDLLKLISDRLTKAELQDIMYNLEEIETEDIVTEYDIRMQKLEEMKEAQRERDKPNNVKSTFLQLTGCSCSCLIRSSLVKLPISLLELQTRDSVKKPCSIPK